MLSTFSMRGGDAQRRNRPAPVFVYLAYGARADLPLQLKYSLITLLREVPSARDRVVLYTDAPATYAGWPLRALALDDVVSGYGREIGYHFIRKPLCVLDALRRFGSAVVFLDTDTYMTEGFAADLFGKLERGAVLNAFERVNPYPHLEGFRMTLPHAGTYAYDPQASVMYNSGIIGVPETAAPMLEDTIALIEALTQQNMPDHTAEQFALSEVLRMSGTPIHECRRCFHHYHRQSVKRYVTMKIAKLLPKDPNDFSVRGRLRLNPFEKRIYDLRRSLRRRA
jgi:hypothetical protein